MCQNEIIEELSLSGLESCSEFHRRQMSEHRIFQHVSFVIKGQQGQISGSVPDPDFCTVPPFCQKGQFKFNYNFAPNSVIMPIDAVADVVAGADWP